MEFGANWQTTLISAIVTGVVGYIIRLVSKGHDARSAAEAALIGTGPTIIIAQNARIEALERNNLALWADLQKSAQMERECRALLAQQASLLQEQGVKLQEQNRRISALEAQLRAG